MTTVRYGPKPHKAGEEMLLDIRSLIARASEGILLLQEACREHDVTLDFAELDRWRRNSYPDNHLYKILSAYFDPNVGADNFSDFQEYFDYDWTESRDWSVEYTESGEDDEFEDGSDHMDYSGGSMTDGSGGIVGDGMHVADDYDETCVDDGMCIDHGPENEIWADGMEPGIGPGQRPEY